MPESERNSATGVRTRWTNTISLSLACLEKDAWHKQERSLDKSDQKSFMSASIFSSQSSLRDNNLRSSNFPLTVTGTQSDKGLNILAAFASISLFSWEDKRVHTFPKGICPKVNVIARLEYELAYYDSAVHRFNHYTHKDILLIWRIFEADEDIIKEMQREIRSLNDKIRGIWINAELSLKENGFVDERRNEFSFRIYQYKYHHHHHHIALVALISLTLSHHSSLSFIAIGRSLQDNIPYPHIAAECMFVLVVLLLHGHVWGSIRVHLLWVRPCFSSSDLHGKYTWLSRNTTA